MIKDRLMSAAIKAFKSHEVDIRDFSISELAMMIELVGRHSPKDLYQFYKFVENSDLESGDFDSLCSLYCKFAEQSFLTDDSNLHYAFF
jgi:hypothetical protein